MYNLKISLVCCLGLVFLTGEALTTDIAKDDCAVKFLGSLIEAGYGKSGGIDSTMDLTLNLKYMDKQGAKQRAAIKLRDHCKEPKILCQGETEVIDGRTLTGPLLFCSWKWNEKSKATDNHVIVRLNQKKAIEVSGTIAKDNEQIFPYASDKGPLDFKFSPPNWKSEKGKGMLRIKRESDEFDEDTTTARSTLTRSASSKASSICQNIHKLTYLLWTICACLIMFVSKW